MPSLHAVALLAVLPLLATASLAQLSEAQRKKDALTGDAKAAASRNPQCALFTPAEVGQFLGTPVAAGQNAAGGSGCQWVATKDDDASALVQVVPPDYFPKPSMAPGFRKLPDIGQDAWVAKDMGWSAGTKTADAGIVVGLDGKTATEAAAIAMLKEAVKRRAR